MEICTIILYSYTFNTRGGEGLYFSRVGYFELNIAFTSTETIRTIRDGEALDDHLDFHTLSELWHKIAWPIYTGYKMARSHIYPDNQMAWSIYVYKGLGGYSGLAATPV